LQSSAPQSITPLQNGVTVSGVQGPATLTYFSYTLQHDDADLATITLDNVRTTYGMPL
jgi:hypothetical protein